MRVNVHQFIRSAIRQSILNTQNRSINISLLNGFVRSSKRGGTESSASRGAKINLQHHASRKVGIEIRKTHKQLLEETHNKTIMIRILGALLIVSLIIIMGMWFYIADLHFGIHFHNLIEHESDTMKLSNELGE